MPTYDFRCGICKSQKNNVVLRITHTEDERPKCCGHTMGQHFTVPPMVHWDDPVIEPFRQVAMPGQPIVTSTKQNRELMKRHDMIDANELGPPPTHADQKAALREINGTVDAITPTAKQKQQLKDSGIETPLD